MSLEIAARPIPPMFDSSPAPVELKALDWDTSFFGRKMGVIARTTEARPSPEALGRELRRVLTQARAERYEHLIFRVPAEDLPVAWAAEQIGFRLVDVGIDSTAHLESLAPAEADDDSPIENAIPDDLPALQELAGNAFVYSRFAVDPFFSDEQVVAFHREWIKNLYRGLAQAVLVYRIDGVPAGFVTCAISNDEGRIPLIATRATDRRRGVGRELIQASLRWFRDAGVRMTHVKTQATNYPALRLYHTTGFTVSHSELTFSIIPDASS